jgi:hypothetical protein
VSLCALLLGARIAHANPDLPVRLALEGCPDLDEGEVRRIVGAELRTRPATESGPNVLGIEVACAGPRVTIRVTDPLSRKAVQRSFNLGLSQPPARARLVAIAATELVLASWAELDVGAPLTVEPEGEKPAAADERAARELAAARRQVNQKPYAKPTPIEPATPYEPPVRHWYDLDSPNDRMFRVGMLTSARTFFTQPGLLWGGGLRVGEERFKLISWSADLLLEAGTVGGEGNHYDIVTATAGGALLLWGRLGPFTGRIGAGLRAGIAQVGGSASSVAPWGWPLGTSSITVRIDRYVALDFSGESGYVVLPGATGQQRDLRSGWFAGQVGFAYTP